MVLHTSISRLALFIPLTLCSVFTLISCTPASAPAPSSNEAQEEYIYHRIKYSGETVAVISAWYTKSAKNWPEIVDANPKMVPSKLRIGDLVRIPKRLVKRFSSLPADFVGSFKSGVNQDTSKGATVVSGTTDSKGDSDSGSSVGSATEKNKNVDKSEDSYNYKEPEVEAPVKLKDSNAGKKEDTSADFGSDTTVVDAPPAVNPDVKAPEAAPPVNDENQKVRDQLMQELLQ